MKKLNLDEVRKAKEFFRLLKADLYLSTPPPLSPENIEMIRNSSCLAYHASRELRDLGEEKLNAICNVLEEKGYELPTGSMKGTTFVTSSLETFSANPLKNPIKVDNVEMSIRVLMTYEIIIPWIDKIREYQAVQGIEKILEGEPIK